jgi:hypothetical protein
MTRLWAFTALTFMLAAIGFTHAGGDKEKSKDFVFKGNLTKDDPKDEMRGGPAKVHTVTLKAGKVYTIDMVSKDFDSYLRLLDPKGNQLEEDDDSGGDLNSRIIFNCTKDGEYKIVTTTFGANMAGAYALTVTQSGGIPKPSSAHAQMIDKPAPDLSADFAVNGKPTKLSALKDKVVLLYFFDVRSGSCEAYLPKLIEWHKTLAKDGLAVVGVMYYPSESGQRLGFDKGEGKIVTAKTANRKSDEALITAYAAHHKIGHLLLVQSKQDALATFDTFVVNGVPQAVLIDRKGTVRFIDVGGEKNAANLETEIKKVLSQK